MNTNQKKYTAFMESVCKEFNCPEALPALNAGFKALCESTMVEYDPFDIDAMVANATDAEFGSDNTDERYNIDRYTGQGVEGPDEESMEEFSDSQIARSLARRLQNIFGQYTPGVIRIYVDPPTNENSFTVGMNSRIGTVRHRLLGTVRVESGKASFHDYGANGDYSIDVDLSDDRVAERIAKAINGAAQYWFDQLDVSSQDWLDAMRGHLGDRVKQKVSSGAEMNDTDFIDAMRNNRL